MYTTLRQTEMLLYQHIAVPTYVSCTFNALYTFRF